MKGRFPSALGRLGLLVAGLAIACVLGELLVRVGSALSPQLRYLATAGTYPGEATYQTLESFLEHYQPHIVPHRQWHNYWCNALGFNDEEFAEHKTPGRVRIMALGDSFCFGSPPYPANVLTVTEEQLRLGCAPLELDLYNFGIPASGVWDYIETYRVASPHYRPDLVLVHIYLGNDVPDLVARANPELPVTAEQAGVRSYLWVACQNALSLLTSRRGPLVSVEAGSTPSAASPPRGGQPVEAKPDETDADRSYTGPSFDDQTFHGISWGEVTRLYAGLTPAETLAVWQPVLDLLTDLNRMVAADGARLIVVAYPSAVQVEPKVFDAAIQGQDPATPFDFDLPNRMLRDFSASAGIGFCDVTPALKEARQAGLPLYIRNDPHWNVRGNHVAAVAEAACLRAFVCP